MKKLLVGLGVISLLLSACSSTSTVEKQTLKVFNWGEYIDTDMIAEFEDLYNAEVIYETYDSNELMYTKLEGGVSYDILIPTDHMVERLIKEGKVQELNLDLIPNLVNVFPDLLNRPFDPNNVYSVPYFWGNIGIIYNKNNVDLADLEADGWNILKNTKYADQIYVYDSARDAFMLAEKALGYSVNTTDEAEIEAAFEWLKEVDQTTHPIYIDETIIDSMINEQKDIAIDFSGDAAYILSQNENMGFFVPAEGTNVWMDSMVIPSDSENVELAHAWINFMLDNEVATNNTIYVGYTSPIIEAYNTVTSEGRDYYLNPAYSPRMDNANDEVYVYDDALKSILADKWTRVKAE